MTATDLEPRSASQSGAPPSWRSDARRQVTLRARRHQFTVSFNGKELFSAEDDRFGSPGKVALWTKADSVTLFENLTISPLQ